jgi:hypothetical protein
MGERQPAVEELLQRIDQLLNVLNIISRDLEKISKSLKAVGAAEVVTGAEAAGEEGLRGPGDIRVLFPKDLEDMLIFEETEEYVVIKPRRYLGSENFAKIASIVRDAGGEYVSAGKDSHFRVPRET